MTGRIDGNRFGNLVLAGLLGSALACGASPAAGQDAPDPREAQPERPTVATHAFPVASGIVELETGVQWQRPSPGTGQLSGPVLFKIGLGRGVQLDVSPGWVWTGPDNARRGGLSDAVIGAKWLVGRDLPILGSFAIQPSIKFPSGSVERGTGTGTTDASLLLVSSRTIGPVALDLNVGYTRRSGGGTVVPANGWLWTVSTGFPVAGTVGWVAELFGSPSTGGVPSMAAFLTGPTWKLRKELILDAGAIFDVTGFGGTAAYAGVTWNIGRAGRSSLTRSPEAGPARRPPLIPLRTRPSC
jgi:hypothetical protein